MGIKFSWELKFSPKKNCILLLSMYAWIKLTKKQRNSKFSWELEQKNSKFSWNLEQKCYMLFPLVVSNEWL